MEYALVTGSTAGIGFAIAEKLLSEGLFVYMNYANNDSRAEAAAKALFGYAGRFEIIKADMSNMDGVCALSEKVANGSGSLKYMVLNSYATDKTGFREITPQDWMHVMDMNVNMPFFLMQRLYNHMSEGGSVCAIGAMMGIHPHGISISYGVSKAALHMLCQSMVKIYATKNITVNAVCPSFIETPYQEAKAPDHRARIENKIALRRFGRPDEIANAVWAVLTNGYINGAVIPVSGGYCME